MQEKMKITLHKDKNLAQVQPQCSVYFCIKKNFESWFFWLVWPFECLILMILTMVKYHKNLLRDGLLPSLSIVKFFSSLETKMILKIPDETFLRITRYQIVMLQSITRWEELLDTLVEKVSACNTIFLEWSDFFSLSEPGRTKLLPTSTRDL